MQSQESRVPMRRSFCGNCRRTSLIKQDSEVMCLRCGRQRAPMFPGTRRRVPPSVECPSCRILHPGRNVGSPYCGRCNRARQSVISHVFVHPFIEGSSDSDSDELSWAITNFLRLPEMPVPRPLPASAYHNLRQKQANPDEDCPICIEDFSESECCVELPCLHCFHEECIHKWFNSKDSCPVCRCKLS